MSATVVHQPDQVGTVACLPYRVEVDVRQGDIALAEQSNSRGDGRNCPFALAFNRLLIQLGSSELQPRVHTIEGSSTLHIDLYDVDGHQVACYEMLGEAPVVQAWDEGKPMIPSSYWATLLR